MKHYSNDPRWITAKFDSLDANGNAVKKGDRIFYYPLTKTVLTGEKAEQAARDFEAAAFDEAVMTGEDW